MSTADPTLMEARAAVTLSDRPAGETDPSPNDRPYRFTVDDFFRMIDLDFFPDDVRVGLWEGQVYEEMAKNHPHSFSWAGLNEALFPLLPVGWSLWAECTVAITRDKAPLPDLLVLRGDRESFRHRHPTAADIGLLVEVADTSLKIDTGSKLAAYAGANIPIYWVVNLKDGVILVYSDPVAAEHRYASTETIRADESIPLVLDGQHIALIPASSIL